MAKQPTKLAANLSEEDLSSFLAELASTPGVNGPMIQRLAKDRFKIEISHNSAWKFKTSEYDRYLDRLNKTSQLARALQTHQDEGDASAIADAAAKLLDEELLDFLMEGRVDLGTEDGVETANKLNLMLSRSRRADRQLTLTRAKLKELELKLKELELKLEESERVRKSALDALERAKSKGGFSEAALIEMEETLRMH